MFHHNAFLCCIFVHSFLHFMISDHFNIEFVQFLFDTIESPPSMTPDPDKLVDLLINLVLSFNLHFTDVKKNSVMIVLAEIGTAKTFTEKLMLLLNRGGKCSFIHEIQYNYLMYVVCCLIIV